MKMMANHSVGKVLVNDGLAMSAVAKKAKKEDPQVINATIGTLYNEDSKFYRLKTVDEIIKSLPDEDFYTYSSSDGGKDFQDASLKWVFGDYNDEILGNMVAKTIPTPGGTGAVSSSLYNALDSNETLLLPNIYWSPYKNMAISNDVNIVEYPYIVNGKFNLAGFIDCAEEIIKKQNKLVTILNDPCNNPTGYSLSNNEFSSLLEYLNSKTDVPCYIIYDIAYFDYYIDGPKKAREKFKLMQNAENNVFINIAFSCSKSFSIYGLRLGGLIMLSKDQEIVNEAYESACFLARTRWSNVSKAGISLLIKLNKDEELKNKLTAELTEAAGIVLNRANIFSKEADLCGLKYYKYGGGFFMTVIFDDGILLAEKLLKEKIYVLGFKKAIRIAICSLPSVEVKGLAKRISEVMNK